MDFRHADNPEPFTELRKSREIARYADVAMFEAEPDEQAARGEPVTPRVYLLSMTPQPLVAMAAASELYAGRVVRDLNDGLSYQRGRIEHWWQEMALTALKAPLEFIDMHFLIEGVTRAFVNQLERQRTAVYVQESLRFAVKTNAALEVAYPPSLMGTKGDQTKGAEVDEIEWQRNVWDEAVEHIHQAYMHLIAAGMPAEDARGLLPLNITTRVHYKTNLRNLAEQAGLRLCSQAQAEWKMVWAGILQAIRNYGPVEDQWQQDDIAALFKPVCYRTGRCEFRGANDRWCVIRDRVEAHHARGEGPDEWKDIDPREPLMEGAARKKPGGSNG